MAFFSAVATNRWYGYSDDEKPGLGNAEIIGDKAWKNIVGDTFTELDTGKEFVWEDNGSWTLIKKRAEILLVKLNDSMIRVEKKLDALGDK